MVNSVNSQVSLKLPPPKGVLQWTPPAGISAATSRSIEALAVKLQPRGPDSAVPTGRRLAGALRASHLRRWESLGHKVLPPQKKMVDL